ncbi:MAG: copper amine oxidase N-terminal domain-containing protein [Clostridiales bacterium]|nr:copper amine oxidase N-terminal domain-containing protein [Clostridiales bacterium]
MKRACQAILFAFFTCLIPLAAYAEESVTETNLAGLTLVFGENTFNDIDSPCITHSDGEKEFIDENYVALFHNGSIVKHPGIIIENSCSLAPLNLVSEVLGLEAQWDGGNAIRITDGGVELRLEALSSSATVGGVPFELDAQPKIADNQPLVPLRFVAEAFGFTVDYYKVAIDEYDYSSAAYLPQIAHVAVSRYPSWATPLSSDEALEKLRAAAVDAFDRNHEDSYQTFVGRNYSFEAYEMSSWHQKEAIDLASVIYTSEIQSENDRFASTFFRAANVLHKIDKYTEKIYKVYYDFEYACGMVIN